MARKPKVYPALLAHDVVCDDAHADLLLRMQPSARFNADLVTESPIVPFTYTRRYLVMTTSGLRTHTISESCEHPRSRGRSDAVLRVPLRFVDMIQCKSTNGNGVEWFMVRVQWADKSSDTWMHAADARTEHRDLLQKLYVATLNSWQRVNKVLPASWEAYPAEDRLWLDDPLVASWLQTAQPIKVQPTDETQATLKRPAVSLDTSTHSKRMKPPLPGDTESENDSMDEHEHVQAPSTPAAAADVADAVVCTLSTLALKAKYGVAVPTPPTSTVACPCGLVADDDDAYLGLWYFCANMHCRRAMHAVCIHPWMRRCPRCEPRPRRTFRGADLVRAAEVNAVHLLRTENVLLDGPVLHQCILAAADAGATDALQYLLTRSPKAEWHLIVDEFGRNPLHLAILQRQASAVAHMLSQRPLLLLSMDGFQQSGMELLLREMPSDFLHLFKDTRMLLRIPDEKNNFVAHMLCRALPQTGFAAIVNVLPYTMFETPNDDGETPVMLACKHPSLGAQHLRALSLPTDWWFHTDNNGHAPLHHLIMAGNGHLLLHVERSVVLESPDLFTIAMQHGQTKAVSMLLSHFTNRLLERESTSQLWPILSAPTPAFVLQLLRCHTRAQLQYVHDAAEMAPDAVQRLVDCMASDVSVLTFLDQLVVVEPDLFSAAFFVRYRHLLAFDAKLLQLQCILTLPTSAVGVTITATTEASCWAALLSASPSIANWREPITLCTPSHRYVSSDEAFWAMLWPQLLAARVLDELHPATMLVLGNLFGHLVCMQMTLPPTPAMSMDLFRVLVNKPNAASAAYITHRVDHNVLETAASVFRRQFFSLLVSALDGWTAVELYVLVFRVPRDVAAWRALAQHQPGVDPHTNETIHLWWDAVNDLPIHMYSMLQVVVGVAPWTLGINTIATSLGPGEVMLSAGIATKKDLTDALTLALRVA